MAIDVVFAALINPLLSPIFVVIVKSGKIEMRLKSNQIYSF